MTDPVDPRLRDFALAPGPGPAFETIARGAHRRRQARAVSRLAAVAVVLLIVGGLAAVVLRGDPSQVQPIDPTPAPTAAPTPTVTATPSVSPSPELEFGVERSPANGNPTAGIGDTVEGLRADAVEFETVTCPDGVPCPLAILLTMTNVSNASITRGVITSVYRDGVEVTGTGAGITLQPGETGVVRVVLDPAVSDVIGATGTPGVYTWNWRLE
jgi:hypothetical protein